MRPHAPRGSTILVAVVFVVIGILYTFGGLRGTFFQIDEHLIFGVGAYVAATLVMLAGIFLRGI